MKKHWILTCLLLSTSALAGQISFEKGDIAIIPPNFLFRISTSGV